ALTCTITFSPCLTQTVPWLPHGQSGGTYPSPPPAPVGNLLPPECPRRAPAWPGCRKHRVCAAISFVPARQQVRQPHPSADPAGLPDNHLSTSVHPASTSPPGKS